MAVTKGREASVTERHWPRSLSMQTVLGAGVLGLQRGEARGLQALSIVLWVIFLEESVAPMV